MDIFRTRRPSRGQQGQDFDHQLILLRSTTPPPPPFLSSQYPGKQRADSLLLGPAPHFYLASAALPAFKENYKKIYSVRLGRSSDPWLERQRMTDLHRIVNYLGTEDLGPAG